MDEDQEPRHACKLCNKIFPCGRSLGGHMRSHVMNSAETHHRKPTKKKLSSLNYGQSNAFTNYSLREKSKKACKFADSSEHTLFLDKLCKECGKGFQSSKALFGHMKCHPERVSHTTVEDDDSWTSQSDDGTVALNRKKRSSKRMKRYMANDATSFSFSVSANASTSVLSEIEQEQEEVAMCLMMLSRDVGHWGVGLNSVGESSDNYSGFLARNLVITKIETKKLMCNDGEIVKFKKLRNGKLESSSVDFENLKSEDRKSKFGATGILRNGYRMKKSEMQVHDIPGKIKEVGEEFRLGENLVKKSEFGEANELGSKKSNSTKRKDHDLFDPKLGMDYSRKLGYGASDSQEKKSKFECDTCKKTFHSYQALGGHRASHKTQKSCLALTKISGIENSNYTDQFSPYSNNPVDHEMVIGNGEKADAISTDSKKNKGSHECPICFRVFSSGQALGGHKRSHLIVVQKVRPIQEEMREFLDLNMPAPADGESSNS
ncbi:hypothetical protein LguiB_022914 [Lonicera macranthoides]